MGNCKVQRTLTRHKIITKLDAPPVSGGVQVSYDEPEILPSSSHPICLMNADAGQSLLKSGLTGATPLPQS